MATEVGHEDVLGLVSDGQRQGRAAHRDGAHRGGTCRRLAASRLASATSIISPIPAARLEGHLGTPQGDMGLSFLLARHQGIGVTGVIDPEQPHCQGP
jgi:hypothetical protein